MLSTVGLVAAVGLILVVGAVLRTGDPDTARPAASAPVPERRDPVRAAPVEATPFPKPEPPREETAPPAFSEPVPVETADALEVLATRVVRDVSRLTPSAGSFTLQLLYACEAETVERVLGRAGGSSDLYVLPAVSGDRACFRVCWGVFPRRADAEADAGPPPAVREGLGRWQVRLVDEVLP